MKKKIEELENLNTTELKDIQASIEHLADHIAHRIEYAESRRSAIATLGGALLASGLALIPFSSQISIFPIKIALLSTAIIWLLFGGLTWVLYARQTNLHYPFTEVAKTPKWFYRYALKDYKAFTAPWHTIQSSNILREGKSAFNKQWEDFKKEQIKIFSNPKEHLMQDLQQVYLLHVNERYKNLFLTHLRTVLAQGIILGLIVGTIVFTSATLFSKKDFVETQKPVTIGDIVSEVIWRATGNSRNALNGGIEKELLINLTIKNKNKDNDYIFEDAKMVIIDDYKMQTPFIVSSMRPQSLIIKPNSQGKAIILIWVPESLVSKINLIKVTP